MKKILFILVLSTNLIGCNRKKIDESLLEGKWSFYMNDRDVLITFNDDGLYSKLTVFDDLVYTTKGTYYFNENTKRSEITISLIPDLKFINGDTVVESCQYLDLINLTDSTFIIKAPTEYSYDEKFMPRKPINSKIIARKER